MSVPVDSDDAQDVAETAADEFEDIDDENVSERKKDFFEWWLKGVGLFLASLVLLSPVLFVVGVWLDVIVVEPFQLGGEQLEVALYIELFTAAMLVVIVAVTVIAVLVKAPGNYLAAISRALAALGGDE